MDYKKKYEEALERAKNYYKGHTNVEPPKPIDWQSVRIEAAMHGMLSTGDGIFAYSPTDYKTDLAKCSVDFADALVEELKKRE